MRTNLHYYYNKCYFEGAKIVKDKQKGVKGQIPDIKARNSTMTNYTLPTAVNKFYDGLPCTHCLDFEVGYPGLVTGIGLAHEINAKGEYKLGMHFDYTYGIPIIYGSSVKGVLHSYFHDFTDRIRLENEGTETVALQIDETKGIRLADDNDLAKKIERAIFGSTLGDDDDENEHLLVGNRDVFFDAIPFRKQGNAPVLSADYLCPHDNNPFKDPIPISFLRISPGVMIRLKFQLFDTIVEHAGKSICITAERKCMLYRTILEEMGLGAKTNVGYGVLISSERRKDT